MRTLIIGGGAAGMAAAIAAARRGETVTVLERGRRELKKLGVTGNGRGNLLNVGAPELHGDTAFAMAVLERMPAAAVADFWRSVGVSLRVEEEGRAYPATLLAGSAVDALRLAAAQLNVHVIPNTRVTALARTANGFTARAMQAQYAPDVQLKSGRVKPGALMGEAAVACSADRVIVTVGGAASPQHGTDGTAYGLLTAFGHTLVAPRPALCALVTETAPLHGLTGQRARAALTLLDAKGTPLHQSRGEILFAEDGVSGIAAMQLARFVTRGCTLQLDLTESLLGNLPTGGETLEAWLAGRVRARAALPLAQLLTGAAAPALAHALYRACGLARTPAELHMPIAQACEKRPALIGMLAEAISQFSLTVTGTRGFENAQVTAGGIAPCDFDPATLQSRLCAGLYAAGEVLDVDGGCGGHNLLFAVASGLLAGQG